MSVYSNRYKARRGIRSSMMYSCIYVHILYYTCMDRGYIHVYICIYMHTYMFIHLYIYIYMYIYRHSRTHIQTGTQLGVGLDQSR